MRARAFRSKKKKRKVREEISGLGGMKGRTYPRGFSRNKEKESLVSRGLGGIERAV